MALALCVLGAISALVTLLGLVCPRRPFVLIPITFFLTWLVGDLALFHLVAQVAVTIVLVARGAVKDAIGLIGLGLMALSWLGLVVLHRRQRAAAAPLDATVGALVGPDQPSVAAEPVAARALLRPFVPSAAGVRMVRNISYGEHRRQRLDVLTPADRRTGCPVLLQIHGGVWMMGNKQQQGQPLMRHLARNGWVCVAMNYRLSPKATFPDHLLDAKRTLAWIREHVAEFGGDPSFVAVTGGSAGGHLSALLALTPNDARYQPGFEQVDTTVQACVPIYGVFDFLDRDRLHQGLMEPVLSKVVMKSRPGDDPDAWHAASPLSQVRADAPPFLVIQGADDTLVWKQDARAFVAELARVSRNPVGYAEIPYAQHAFDLMTTRRSVYMVRAVSRFLEHTYANRHAVR